MLQQAIPRAHVRSRHHRKSIRYRHRRSFGRPWPEIICLVGIVVVLAVAASQFIAITGGFI